MHGKLWWVIAMSIQMTTFAQRSFQVVLLVLLPSVSHADTCWTQNPAGWDWRNASASTVMACLRAGAPSVGGNRNLILRSPCHWAAQLSPISVVEIFASNGLCHEYSANGTTPLHDAAGTGRADVVRTLLEGGVNPLPMDDLGQTPADHAVRYRAEPGPVLEVLREFGGYR